MSQVQTQSNVVLEPPQLTPLSSPKMLKDRLPLSEDLLAQIERQRSEIQDVVLGRDKRLLVIVGPCSLHCDAAAIDYAKRLAVLADQYSDKLLIVMRAYLEKPRTTVGWKGMLYDPLMDGSDDLALGLEKSRQLLREIVTLGLPIATEALNPLAVPYLDDLLAWVAVGARTTESQTHREMASGLPCTVGFKNGTDGGLDVAIHALLSAARPHSFLSMCQDGQIHHIRSTGNGSGQLVLRGGKHGPNFDAVHMAQAKKLMASAGLYPSVVVDCSHENSGKDHTRQASVVSDVIAQKAAGCDTIKGVMLESYLAEGRQNISANMDYGQSVTDACIGWEETESLIRNLHAAL
jgi:3-deoxy-7-phosphoheptulonate synthase